MDRLFLLLSLLQVALDLLERTYFGNTGSFRFLLEGRLDAHPDNGIDGQLIPKDDLPVVVDVDNGGQSGIRQAEEIEEGGILTEMIGVVGIIHATLVISQKQQQSGTDCLFQFRPTGDVCIFTKHVI